MNKDEIVEIKLKKKALFFKICAVLLILFMAWFILTESPEDLRNSTRPASPFIMYPVGIVLLAFSGYNLVKIFIQIKRAYGLKISHSGINDNSHSESVGYIPYSEIIKMESKLLKKRLHIIIHVVSPNKYSTKYKSAFLNKFHKGFLYDYTLIGSPVYIVVGALRYDPEKILNLIEEKSKIKIIKF